MVLGCWTAYGQRKVYAAEIPRSKASAESVTAQAEAAASAIEGSTPPDWQVERWLNSPPLHVRELRGKVVLVRWWTAGCPYCSHTAPALRHFFDRYSSRGLAVVGIYHHKEEGPFNPKLYEETAQRYHFAFPLAFDPEWRTFKSWMRDRHGKPVNTGWTSVTFVLDKKGVVRHVHPGGEYIEGDPAHQKLTSVLEELLAER
jgi:peroxiredoxin